MTTNIKIHDHSSWMFKERPYYFFGPCSAESLEQMRQTAAGIKKHYDKVIFRAGIWKPRTRPNSFEGFGEKALDWLCAIKEEFGFKITTEVANPYHLEKCLEAGVDIVWLGARTTVNPFAVQALADALKGVDIPVFVKNPINPDLPLWIGALERINGAGIKQLGAIHRGFHLSENGPYRNYPRWDLAVQLKAHFPNLPVICDVSHISGDPRLIPHVAQKSIDLAMDGLMVEAHFNPKMALSDAKQQMTPDALQRIMEHLTPKSKSSENPEFTNKVEVLRAKIDQLDEELLEQIAIRMDVAKEIGSYKNNNRVTVLQISRWKQILDQNLKNGKSLGLSESFIHEFLNVIHDESIRQQTDEAND